MSATINNLKTLDLKKTYTYADYLLWDFKERVELIKGKVFKMSPAPSSTHQRISGELTYLLSKVFRKTTCQMFAAPFDVRLVDYKKTTADNQIISVVQPDICVICDSKKIDERGCVGAPDLIIEILSPGNSNREMTDKYDLYEENGVKEYWIVNQSEKTILIYLLNGEKFIGLKPITENGKLESPTFPNLKFSVKSVFNTK